MNYVSDPSSKRQRLTTETRVSTKLKEAVLAAAQSARAVAVGHFQRALFVDQTLLAEKGRCGIVKRDTERMLVISRLKKRKTTMNHGKATINSHPRDSRFRCTRQSRANSDNDQSGIGYPRCSIRTLRLWCIDRSACNLER